MPPAWAPEVPTPHLVTWPATLRRPLDTPLVPVPRPGPAARLTRPPPSPAEVWVAWEAGGTALTVHPLTSP